MIITQGLGSEEKEPIEKINASITDEEILVTLDEEPELNLSVAESQEIHCSIDESQNDISFVIKPQELVMEID